MHRRPTPWLTGLLATVVVAVLAGCAKSAPAPTGPLPDEKSLQTNFQKALASVDAMDAANAKGDTDGARAQFSSFQAAWTVIAPAVSAKDSAAYKKLQGAVEELQAEFAKAKPRKGELEEEADVLRDTLKQVAPALGQQSSAPAPADPAKLVSAALGSLGEIDEFAGRGDWSKARTEYAEFNQAAMSLRLRLEAKDKAAATELNARVDGLETALRPEAPDKAAVKAATAAATQAVQKTAQVLGIKT